MNGPTSYAYDAALHCLDCTRERFAGITDGNADEYRDSEGNAPTPVYSWSDEADTPQHCDECRTFLENSLTRDGIEYVVDAIADALRDPEVWAESVALNEWYPYYRDQLALGPRTHDRIIRATTVPTS